MLQNIREHVKGWVAGVVIVLVGSTFVLFGVEYYVQSNSAQKAVVAEVNGEKITEQELTQAFHQLQRQEQAALKVGSLTSDQNAQIKQMALNNLVTNMAMSQAALKSGFYVSLDQAKALLLQVPAFQVNGQFSNDRFQQAIYNSGFTPAQFFGQIQNSILMAQLKAGLQNSEFTLAHEVNALASLLKETRSFGFFMLPLSQFRAHVKISDAQLKNYYSHNLAQFKTPEKVRLQYLLLSPEDLAKSVSVSDQEVKEYYESNPENFSSVKRWQINRYLIPLSAEARGGALNSAKDEATALQEKLRKNENTSIKPVLSWLTQDQVSGPLALMMAKLKVGDVSAPFRTAEGFNVIKVVNMEASQEKSFASVKDNIKKALVHQKVQQLLTAKSEQLSNLVYTNPNTLDVAAKTLNLVVQKSDWLGRNSGTGIFADPKILDVAFSEEVLNQGNNSTPIELKGGSLMVLRVSEHEKSQTQPLSEVREKIHTLLVDQQAQREAGLKAYQLQSELQKGVPPSKLAQQYSLVWQSKDQILRGNKTLAPELLSTVFKLKFEAKQAQAASVLVGGKAYAVVLLTAVHRPSDPKLENKESLALQRNLLVLDAEILYRLYVKSILGAAKIVVHSGALA